MDKRRVLKLMLATTLGTGAVGWLAGCSREEKVSFQGVDVTGAEYARDFSLPDANGQLRTLKDFAGKVVVVFFGYTQCPDVCPTTLQELAEVKQLLGADGERLQAIFVSLDPERDTPEMLKAYMGNFDPSFVALRGTPEQTAAIAKDFKIFYKKVEGQTPQTYTLDHSAGSYVYDPAGRLRVYERYGSGPQVVVSDVRTLLSEKS
ncbi:SCO family protein [Acidovorax sp. Be4]|uniref:SCO family protein n=1 Tax=Acidovorax bellezanensis TaxID=2976702 RepID=A0ABT2PI18_9BURK|nr:SCO family protein [Acidovorax sp. Be4]MCT9810118.1 SCO family protein [Acidovorax sp. Be4]